MKKDQGIAENLIGLVLFAVMLIFSVTMLQLAVHQASSTYIEDALAASNLASAVIDLDVYGETGELAVRDPAGAYLLYKKALKDNLRLNALWECENKSVISGKVTVYEYILYQVSREDVTEYRFGAEGMQEKAYPQGRGRVTAPDGTLIHTASVYSRIGFPVDSMGREFYCYKEKCVDVVRNGSQGGSGENEIWTEE